MFELVGISNEVGQERIGEPFLDHYTEDVVATFDKEEDAKAYIRESRLKHVQRRPYASDVVFKKGTLLRNCVSAYIQGHEDIEIPHNPVTS